MCKFPPLLFGSQSAEGPRKRRKPLAGAAGPPHLHCGMAATARCPPRPPGAPDPDKRGKRKNPRALADCACGCCPAVKGRQGLSALGAPTFNPARRTCTRDWQEPCCAPSAGPGPHFEARGLPTPSGAKCALRAWRTKPSGPPSPRVLGAPRCPRPGLLEVCGGHASPACPGRRGAGTRAARRIEPTPAREAPRLWLCETRPQWCASGNRRWCEPGSTSWHRERGPALLCLPLRLRRRAPPGPRRFPALRGRRASACTSVEDRPDAGPDRRPQLLDRVPAQRSSKRKETGTSLRCRCYSHRLTNRKKPCLHRAECLLIEL